MTRLQIIFRSLIVVSMFCGTNLYAQNSLGDISISDVKSYETTLFPSRLVYLNGANISNVKNQELRSVDIKIDESGNIHISAPNYDVIEESEYHPLLPSELPRYSRSKESTFDLPNGTFNKLTGEAEDPVAKQTPSKPQRALKAPDAKRQEAVPEPVLPAPVAAPEPVQPPVPIPKEKSAVPSMPAKLKSDAGVNPPQIELPENTRGTSM